MTDDEMVANVIFAVDDQDIQTLARLLKEAASKPFGTLMLVSQLAGVAAHMMRQLEGDEWRNVLSTGLLFLSLDENDG